MKLLFIGVHSAMHKKKRNFSSRISKMHREYSLEKYYECLMAAYKEAIELGLSREV